MARPELRATLEASEVAGTAEGLCLMAAVGALAAVAGMTSRVARSEAHGTQKGTVVSAGQETVALVARVVWRVDGEIAQSRTLRWGRGREAALATMGASSGVLTVVAGTAAAMTEAGGVEAAALWGLRIAHRCRGQQTIRRH